MIASLWSIGEGKIAGEGECSWSLRTRSSSCGGCPSVSGERLCLRVALIAGVVNAGISASVASRAVWAGKLSVEWMAGVEGVVM